MRRAGPSTRPHCGHSCAAPSTNARRRGAVMRTRKLIAAASLALAVSMPGAPAFAGGPLVIVPTAQGLEPARWEGTVPVYADLGGLGLVDHAQAVQLLQNALQQWSSVETSNFRATLAGTLGDL